MPRWDNERGVYRCHTIMNCVEACPKELHTHRGHTVAQEGGGAAQAVPEGEVARHGR